MSATDDDNCFDENDKVGYKHPPKQHQFKKGFSGNPNGRKPKPTDMDGLMDYHLEGKINVTIDGRQKKLARREVVAIKQIDAAMRGMRDAVKFVFEHDRARGKRRVVTEAADLEIALAAARRLALQLSQAPQSTPQSPAPEAPPAATAAKPWPKWPSTGS